MISVTELRAGTLFTEGNDMFEVLAYEHKKLGRGTATIKVKIRNIRTQSVIEKSFISGARVKPVDLDKVNAVFLYKQGEAYVFMDPQTFDQHSVSTRIIGDKHKYLTDGTEIKLLLHNNEPLSIELPIKMEFSIADTPPGVKGNSATNIWKEASLANGHKVKVPLFVDIGDKIIVDSRTGEYIERVGK